MSEMKIDVVIAGGGILGLLSAKHIKETYPHLEIAVFEKEMYFGEHTSGRNSGVIHAGLYYPYDSLKRKHCLQGKALWNDLAKDLDFTLRLCGKYVVSASKVQDQELEGLYQKAIDNEVQEIRWATSTEVDKLSKDLHCTKAFHSGTSGVIDPGQAIKQVAQWLESNGVYLLKKQKISHLHFDGKLYQFQVDAEKIYCTHFINNAGLEATEIRKQLGLNDIEKYFVRGNYLSTSQKLNFSGHIYPVPPKDLKGLGVHYTLNVDGSGKFGPNTVDVQEVNYDLSNENKEEMVGQVKALFKNIDESKLYLDYSGIRPKIKKNGVLYKDFLFQTEKDHGLKNYIEFLGIESPGLTAAPSLAKEIVLNV